MRAFLTDFGRRPIFNFSQLAILTATIGLLSTQTSRAQSLNQRLGYPDSAKLLILHADDLGVSHSENQASFEALVSKSVNSASIMVPCPWLPEMASFARGFRGADLGLHLTLTSEWKYFKWGPVAPRDSVSSLVDSLGYFYDNCADLAAHAVPAEVETELRAQIAKAKAMGIEPTHLDSHMGCLFFTTPELFEIYLKLGREYHLPVLVARDMLAQLPEALQKAVSDKDIVLDHAITATPEDYKGGMPAYYERVLRGLEPGVSAILMHLAYDGAEMRGVTFDHPDWGAAWRQADFDFFTSEDCQKMLKELGIQLITWKEIGKLLNK